MPQGLCCTGASGSSGFGGGGGGGGGGLLAAREVAWLPPLGAATGVAETWLGDLATGLLLPLSMSTAPLFSAALDGGLPPVSGSTGFWDAPPGAGAGGVGCF